MMNLWNILKTKIKAPTRDAYIYYFNIGTEIKK